MSFKMEYCQRLSCYTHNSAAKTQGELFSTSTYMMVQRKTLPTMGEQPEWEDPHLQNSKAI